MAYTTPTFKNVGDTFTAAEYNAFIRDNGEAGVPGLMTAKGDLAVATGLKAASRLPVGTNGFQLVADSSQATGLVWVTRQWFTGQWTNTSWDGDNKGISTTTITVNSFNAGVPNAAIAVLVWISCRAAAVGNLVRVATLGTQNNLVNARTQANNQWSDANGLVPLDVGRFDVIVSANNTEVFVEIGGYLI